MSERAEMQDLRLLLYLPALGDGGAERTTAALAEDFARHGADVRIVTDYEPAQGIDLPEGVRLERLRGGHLAQIRHLRALLKGFRPHAALSAIAASPLKLALAARGLRIPLAHVFHGLEEWRTGRLSKLTWRALPLIARTGHIIAVSRVLRDYMAHAWRVPEARITTLQNPVRLPDPLPQVTVRSLAAREPVILCIGRLSREKQFGMAIRALSLMHHEEARLILVGEGPQRQALEFMVKELGLKDRVTFAGWQADIWPYLARAKVFCLPSRTESFGIAAVEALAAGLPVIGTATPGLKEVIGANPKLGQLVEITDIEGLAAELDAALDDPGCPGPRQAHARTFAAETVLPQWRAFVRRLAGQR